MAEAWPAWKLQRCCKGAATRLYHLYRHQMISEPCHCCLICDLCNCLECFASRCKHYIHPPHPATPCSTAASQTMHVCDTDLLQLQHNANPAEWLTNSGSASLVRDSVLVMAGGEGERVSYRSPAGCIRCILAMAFDGMLMSHMYIWMHTDLIGTISTLSQPSLLRSKTSWCHLLSLFCGYQSCNMHVMWCCNGWHCVHEGQWKKDGSDEANDDCQKKEREVWSTWMTSINAVISQNACSNIMISINSIHVALHSRLLVPWLPGRCYAVGKISVSAAFTWVLLQLPNFPNLICTWTFARCREADRTAGAPDSASIVNKPQYHVFVLDWWLFLHFALTHTTCTQQPWI